MSKQKQSVIIFDLDGTLTDSAEGIIRSAQYMQEKMGIPKWEDEELRFIVGPPLLKTFVEDFSMTDEDAEKALMYFRERYTTVGLFENKVYPGVEDMLKLLIKKGKSLAVATSKKEESAVRILAHFGIDKYFQVIGGDDREAGRDTKAKVIAYVMDTMGAEKSDVIMVGDRKYDIEGAHALGLPCIAVEYGYGDKKEFEESGAELIAETPLDVANMF